MLNSLFALVLFFLCMLGIEVSAKPMTYALPVGWHWYNAQEKPKTNPKQDTHSSLPTFTTASDALKFQQKVINEAKAQAVIDPTPEHIRLYRYLQAFVFRKVTQFTSSWQKVSLSDPTLDFVASHPTASAAQPLLHQQAAQREKMVIDRLKYQFILSYIYKSRDPLEFNFEKTVKRFAQENDWPLKEIDLSDSTLMQQQGAKAMRQWLLGLNLPKTPALLLVNPNTQETFPLAFGYIAQTEIEKRCGIWLADIKKERWSAS